MTFRRTSTTILIDQKDEAARESLVLFFRHFVDKRKPRFWFLYNDAYMSSLRTASSFYVVYTFGSSVQAVGDGRFLWSSLTISSVFILLLLLPLFVLRVTAPAPLTTDSVNANRSIDLSTLQFTRGMFWLTAILAILAVIQIYLTLHPK